MIIPEEMISHNSYQFRWHEEKDKNIPHKREHRKIMKINRYHVLLLSLLSIGCFLAPVSAVVAGNSTNGNPVYPVKAITPGASYGTPYPTLLPETTGPVNLPVPAILLVIGAIIVIIAIGGLFWRYLHPKYVPPGETKE
jgi:hypothetical protein